jgi:LEA14-like dessication related protein
MRFPSASMLPLLALAAACASLAGEPLIAPEVSLVDIAVREITPLETTVELSLRYANENPVPLVTSGSVHVVALDGVRVGKALSNRGLEIPRLGEVEETIALRIDNVKLLVELAGLMSHTSADYALESKVYLSTGRGERVLTSAQSGTLALPETLHSELAPLRELELHQELDAGGTGGSARGP